MERGFCESTQKKLKTVETTNEENESISTTDLEEEECMICLDAKPTTTVIPCGHRVVCDDCSVKLKETPDNQICTQCRCEITHVFYKNKNKVEIKQHF